MISRSYVQDILPSELSAEKRKVSCTSSKRLFLTGEEGFHVSSNSIMLVSEFMLQANTSVENYREKGLKVYKGKGC